MLLLLPAMSLASELSDITNFRQYSDHLASAGQPTSDQLKLLARGVIPVEMATGGSPGAPLGMRIFVEDPGALKQIATVLGDAAEKMPKAARGPIYLRLSAPGLPGEVEMDLSEPFPVTPEIKGAVKSLAGVMAVEDC